MTKKKREFSVSNKRDSLAPFHTVMNAMQERHGRELRRQERLYGKKEEQQEG